MALIANALRGKKGRSFEPADFFPNLRRADTADPSGQKRLAAAMRSIATPKETPDSGKDR